MSIHADLKPVRVSAMNAVHDLAVFVARDEGLFRDEGLDVEILSTLALPRSTLIARRYARGSSIAPWNPSTILAMYGVSHVRVGVMKRTVEAMQCGQRTAKIVALGAAMSKMAIITAPNSHIYEPEQLKDTPVAVSPFNGSHFTTLKMLEGFVKKRHIWWYCRHHARASGGGAHRRGGGRNFMEPWISIAQKQGFRILIESHSTRSEAASDDLDEPYLAAMFRLRPEPRS